jgi:hypothetical protein
MSEISQAQNMGFGQIVYMDVVSNASSIGSRIIVAEYLEGVALSVDRLENRRDQMCFRSVDLAEMQSSHSLRSIDSSRGNSSRKTSHRSPTSRYI